MRLNGKTYILGWADEVCISGVSRSAKALALACMTHANYGNGEDMAASLVTLAAESSMSVASAKRARKELEAAGLLTWNGKNHAPGHARKFRCTKPEQGPLVTSVPKPTRVEKTGNRGQVEHQQGSPMSRNQGHQGHQAAHPLKKVSQAPGKPRVPCPHGKPGGKNPHGADGSLLCFECDQEQNRWKPTLIPQEATP